MDSARGSASPRPSPRSGGPGRRGDLRPRQPDRDGDHGGPRNAFAAEDDPHGGPPAYHPPGLRLHRRDGAGEGLRHQTLRRGPGAERAVFVQGAGRGDGMRRSGAIGNGGER